MKNNYIIDVFNDLIILKIKYEQTSILFHDVLGFNISFKNGSLIKNLIHFEFSQTVLIDFGNEIGDVIITNIQNISTRLNFSTIIYSQLPYSECNLRFVSFQSRMKLSNFYKNLPKKKRNKAIQSLYDFSDTCFWSPNLEFTNISYKYSFEKKKKIFSIYKDNNIFTPFLINSGEGFNSLLLKSFLISIYSISSTMNNKFNIIISPKENFINKNNFSASYYPQKEIQIILNNQYIGFNTEDSKDYISYPSDFIYYFEIFEIIGIIFLIFIIFIGCLIYQNFKKKEIIENNLFNNHLIDEIPPVLYFPNNNPIIINQHSK